MTLQIRDPMVRMYQKTFYYHFNNRPILSYRNDTWLCFEVETKNAPASFLCGVFRNQGPRKSPYHTELCFLTWFQHRMSPDQDYQVTWYVSWSPCANCAQQVADFLSKYPKVSLTILTARLYYFWVPDFRQGILRMDQKGAKVRIMDYEEFEHCWEKFVHNNGKPWVINNNKLKKNYQILVTKLEEILRDPIERISPKIFYHQFNNTTSLRDRTSSWLCFTVKTNKDSNAPASFRCGVFRNQGPPKTPCHTENCFLTWLKNLLSSDQDYQVTWYTSWSPCADCAGLVADFLASHTNVSLTIFAARLYYHREPETQRGLRRMHQKGAQLHIMSLTEFKHCWEKFVHNQGKPFQPWDGLNENHELLDTQLQEILSGEASRKKLWVQKFAPEM
ncbi:DNA dC-_dU-editing enzyme APOBEC-3F-like [Eulemur rufifrons]|uniref:DNA dC->dU-editing enzyme APOBEC-3F-like n=1 Tax=Eulemur rufifrons TaxID=859984 RepID=UPI003744ACA6